MSETVQSDVDRFETYFREHFERVAEVAQGYPSEHETITVELDDLYRQDPSLVDYVQRNPDDARRDAQEALEQVEQDLPDQALHSSTLDRQFSLSEFDVLFSGVTDAQSFIVGEYSHHDVGQIVGVRGDVNKMSEKRPIPVRAVFTCERCGTKNINENPTPSQLEPHECHGCERKGPFRSDPAKTEWRDVQTIRLQLPPEKSRGRANADIDIQLESDLVGSVDVGDRVRVDAVLGLQREADDRLEHEYVGTAEGVHVEDTDFTEVDVSDEQLEQIREIAADEPFELIRRSIAPSILGLETEKTAIALQMFGGTRKPLPDGSVERGDSHVLFVGDPGTGKSELLGWADRLSPRSVYSDGKGSTSAGLTASAVKDDFGSSQWTIEGGTIVKAHKGIACVDELDDMDPEDRSALHTALEKQVVPVAKAGENLTLPAQTTLLAAANPTHGRFDIYESIPDQIGLNPALVSRFDLIFTLSDVPEREKDREIIDHKVKTARAGQQLAAGKDVDENLREKVEPAIDPEIMRAYIAHAKREIMPEFTDAAEALIRDEFLDMRLMNADNQKDPEENPIPVTLRKQEAIHRLCEASARVRLSERVEVEDVQRALRLVKQSMEDVGIDPETGDYDADVVETGSSRSQEQKMKLTKQLIEEAADEHTGIGAKQDDVVEALQAEGYTERQAEHSIDKLLEKGHVYNPQQGIIALS